MLFSDKIKLRTVTYTEQDFGEVTETDVTEVEVWADKRSVIRSEFYTAQTNGYDLVIAFEVHQDDYSGQKEVEYGGKVYKVERMYEIGLGKVQLNCSDKKVD